MGDAATSPRDSALGRRRVSQQLAPLRALPFFLFFALVLSGTPALAGAPCTCAEARERMGWCEAHEVGHIAGVEIRSAELFEALDAHGQVIEDRFLGCETCLRAKASGGYCDEHRRGFVDGLAYLSPLTYHLAGGRVRDPDAIECPVCRKNADSHGWCAKCSKGMFSGVEIDGRAAFEQADHAYHTLLEARKTAERCEKCAAATVIDGRCPYCKISYRDGRPVKE